MVFRVRENRRSGGFTLIELVVVLAILAAAAGLLIPRLDFMRRSADTASAATGMNQLMSNLQLFRTVKGTYPDRFDSLLQGTDAAPGTPDPVDDSASAAGADPYEKLFNHPASAFEPFKIPVFTGAPGTDQSGLSFLHLIGPNLYDHSLDATFATDSGSVLRDVSTAYAATGFWVARVKIAGSSTATNIRNSIYTDGVMPTGVTLVALGVGARCTANGVTMSAPPLYAGVNPEDYYGRFIAIFAVYTSGKRAELKAVVDPTGQVVNAQIRNFHQNQPE
jgi:prepilin-type N-terminal cleavage/methylation domain-containing protein